MRNTLIAASVLALVAGSASAASVTYIASVDGADIVGSSGFGTITLPDFDSTLGTLTGITVTFTGDWATQYRAVADTDSGDASAADDFVTTTVSNVGASTGFTIGAMSSSDGSAFTEFVDFGDPYSQDTAGLLSGGGAPGAAFFAAFTDTGSGTVDWFFNGGASRVDDLDDGLLSGLQAFAYDLDAEITYTYSEVTDQVPVPAALPLLAAAFGVMGFVRSRRA